MPEEKPCGFSFSESQYKVNGRLLNSDSTLMSHEMESKWNIGPSLQFYFSISTTVQKDFFLQLSISAFEAWLDFGISPSVTRLNLQLQSQAVRKAKNEPGKGGNGFPFVLNKFYRPSYILILFGYKQCLFHFCHSIQNSIANSVLDESRFHSI